MFKKSFKEKTKDNKYKATRQLSSRIRYAIAFYVRERQKLEIKIAEKIIAEEAPKEPEIKEEKNE